MLANLFLAAMTTALLSVIVDDPWITGDRALLLLAEQARYANAQSLAKHGELIAVHTEFKGAFKAPRLEATVRCAWLGEKYLSDVVVRTPLDGRPRPDNLAAAAEWDELRRQGKDLEPKSVRVLFDGRRYLVYYPQGITHSGHLLILASQQQLENSMYAAYADQRPHVQWDRHPSGYPWTHWMKLDDRTNPRVARWIIELDANAVRLRRIVHWQEGGGRWRDGAQVILMNLDRAGAVVDWESIGKDGGAIGPERERSKGEYFWEKIEPTIVVLRRYRYSRETKDGSSRQTYELKEISLAHKNASEFTEKGLRIRAGARVDDRIAGKTYVYGNRPVSQQDLDALIKKAKGKIRGGG